MEAIAEGLENVDHTELEKFRIRKVEQLGRRISRHTGSSAGYKFKKSGNTYIEKKPYRKDKERKSGGFNVMPYVFNRS